MRISRLLVSAFVAVMALSFISPASAERDRDPGAFETIKRAPAAPARVAAKPKPVQTSAPASVADVVASGNNGELRSEVRTSESPIGLFGRSPASLLPQTQALDSVLEKRQGGKTFAVKNDFLPQTVSFSGYPRGTIVIDTANRYLYLVESGSTARRYAIAVGREGLEFKGEAKVGDKQEWPRWIPTQDMQKREPKKYGQYKDGMPGGPDNPLGARAIYLHQNNKDTHIRIHGTNQPQTIGTNSSNGCFRMINEHVMDLYGRVPMGANVVVL
ncbi:L,D-transpeptidase [Aquibium carbonis]|uniref:L,D-transpeptidase n=1 Tax=Aquibium carbonis TaxID=2495581 RepID=A0A3R9YV28_9HYPH|nr:L,D-transpeptidase [Aquibium carbonis]